MNFNTAISFFTVCATFVVLVIMSGNPSSYVDLHALITVFGGTIAAAMLAFGPKTFLHVISISMETLKNPALKPMEGIEKIVECANVVRKNQGSLLGLAEYMKANEKNLDVYFRKALELAIDGKRERVVALLKKEKMTLEEEYEAKVTIFEKMALWLPASGMIGTLLGLVQMMQNMNDPSEIGPAMGLALVATFYGAVAANWFVEPLAENVKKLSADQITYLKIIAEGFHRLMNNENPMEIEEQLMVYLERSKRK